MRRYLVNGMERAAVDTADRGLNYGDGLFETIAVLEGRPRNWNLHMQRMRHGCEVLGIPTPDHELLSDELARLVIDMPRAVIKIVLTRGNGGRGYRYEPNNIEPTRIVSSHDWPEYPDDYYKKGIRLTICDTSISQQTGLAGIKHLNRLENVLARNEWQDDDYVEGLMLDIEGKVIEGTMSNLFWVEGDKVFTPLLDKCGVQGVMRQRVMECAAEMAIPCGEEHADLERIKAADELFVTNSIIGIWPATLSAKPTRGKITARLMQKLADTDGILFI